MEYTHFGYEYLYKISSSLIHSGVDLNYGKPYQDFKKPIKSMANGEVVFSKNTGNGWGNLIVIYHAAYGVWTRYAHLERRDVKEGDKVSEGQTIGLCGDSGGTWAPHLHFDVIKKELPYWTKYTRLWSRAKVKEFYHAPLEYIAEMNEAEDNEPAIVKWHKDNKIIEVWESPPSPEELKLGWAIYKGLKVNSETELNFNLK